MSNDFHAVFEREGDYYIGYALEVPGANGQGRTIEECRENLIEAVKLILEDRREDALKSLPEDATPELITVG